MFGTMGIIEIVLILLIIVLFFGGKRVPGIGRALGQGVREIRKAFGGHQESDGTSENTDQSGPPTGGAKP